MSSEEYPYQKAWKNYRRRLRLIAALIPLVLLMFILLSFESLKNIQNPLAVASIAILIVIAAIVVRMTFWKCPRCLKFYFRWWDRMQVLFGKRCQNCKLEKYEGSSFNGLLS